MLLSLTSPNLGSLWSRCHHFLNFPGTPIPLEVTGTSFGGEVSFGAWHPLTILLPHELSEYFRQHELRGDDRSKPT
jgi:hypothetical protein